MQNKGLTGLKTNELLSAENVSEETVANLAEYIMEKYEKPLFLKVLNERYSNALPFKKNYVLLNFAKYASDSELGYEARKKLIEECIYKYFKEGKSTLFTEGFVFFRLKRYESILEELAEKIFEDRMAELEYEEFIRLLRYFVNIQENRPKLINVSVRAEGVYEIFDADGKNITQKCLEDFFSDENNATEVNFDDLLISMLITLAPKKIAVHGGEKIINKELFTTIGRVFDGDVFYCGGCTLFNH